MNEDTPPICTICIANYNGERVLIDCLESILTQQGNIPVEIIIHDDASTDNSVAILKKHYPSTKYPYIQIIESQENVGFCASNNRMAAVANGEYILLLNNDATLATDAIQSLFEAANSQSTRGILSLPQYDWETGALVDRGCLLDPFYNPVPNLDPKRRDVAMVIGACMWIPRALWDKLGGFPEWFESIGEDLQICCQARLWGYPVQVLQSSRYWHRQGMSFGGNRVIENRLATTYRRRRLSERNKTFVMILCSPTFQLALTLPFHLLLLALEGCAISVIKRSLGPWRKIYGPTFTELISRHKTLESHRKELQEYKKTRNYIATFTMTPHKFKILWRHGVPKIT